ncbi:hypothetical protein KKC97_02190 [bacterium]|nr:hypothetical protein [bacterium]MBU1636454.1 hypothetical protein [bacterium]MBU1921457.1 hypothetical protein [bacterium]
MSSITLRKLYATDFIVFLWKLFTCWLIYSTLAAIYRLSPLRRLINRLEIVQGRARLKPVPPATDFMPAAQA